MILFLIAKRLNFHRRKISKARLKISFIRRTFAYLITLVLDIINHEK